MFKRFKTNILGILKLCRLAYYLHERNISSQNSHELTLKCLEQRHIANGLNVVKKKKKS